MKRFTAMAAFIAFAGVVSAQKPALAPVGEWQSMKIIQTEAPLFPIELQQLGVRSGEAQVVLSVSAEGKLTDWLVVAYTLRPFADSAVRALKHWRYEPAKLRGEPVDTTSELTFNFKIEGTQVVSQNLSEYLQARTLQIFGPRYAFRAYTLKELDKIPTPIVVVSPQYPRALAEKGVKGRVTINFYIDQDGNVRMPAASPKEDPRLTGLAIDALSKWKFDPPTVHGRPVLVKASQVFNFGTADGSS